MPLKWQKWQTLLPRFKSTHCYRVRANLVKRCHCENFCSSPAGKEKPPLDGQWGLLKRGQRYFSDYYLPLCKRAAFGFQEGFGIEETPAHFAVVFAKPSTLSRAGAADLQAGTLLGFGDVLSLVEEFGYVLDWHGAGIFVGEVFQFPLWLPDLLCVGALSVFWRLPAGSPFPPKTWLLLPKE